MEFPKARKTAGDHTRYSRGSQDGEVFGTEEEPAMVILSSL